VLVRARVVIRYIGKPVCSVLAPHGNSHTDRPFIRTNPSVGSKIKELLTGTGGQAGPAKMCKKP